MRKRRAAERDEEAEKDREIRSIMEYSRLVPESRFGVVDLVQFPFQIEPFYSDEIAARKEVVYIKSTQVGASTGLWRWAVMRADQYGERVIYYFPTDNHVTDFGDQRIEPSIEASDYLRSRIPQKNIRRKTLKQIGLGDISLRGMQSLNAVQSVDADDVVIDEYDECDPTNISHAERRLSGAVAAGRSPKIRRAGRPSIPGYGIDLEFQESDQRHWVVTCPECGDEQQIEWSSVRWLTREGGNKVQRAGHDEYAGIKDVTRAWRACRSCEHSLEPPEGMVVGPIHEGRWQAMVPDAKTAGFHIPRLIVPRTDLEAIVVASRSTRTGAIQTFHNADLGVAWASEDAKLTDAILDAAAADPDAYPDNVTGPDSRYLRSAGIDVAGARDLNIRVSDHLRDGRRRAVHISMPKDFQEVSDIINRLGVNVFVVDSMPERRSAQWLLNQHPGRGFMVRYDYTPESDTLRYDETNQMITVNRTEAIDAMFDSFRLMDNVPLSVPPRLWKEQMKSLVRRVVEDSKGRPMYVYERTGGNGDDYAHAEVYDLVAQQMMMLMDLFDAQAEAAEPTPVNSLRQRQGGFGPGMDPDEYDPGFGEEI